MYIRLTPDNWGHPIRKYLERQELRDHIASLYDFAKLIAEKVGERFPKVRVADMIDEGRMSLGSSAAGSRTKPKGTLTLPIYCVNQGERQKVCDLTIVPVSAKGLFTATAIRWGFDDYRSSKRLDQDGLIEWILGTVAELAALGMPLE